MKAAIGQTAVEKKGWLASHRWLLLRRLTQLTVVILFVLGPVADIWILKGNLSTSLVLDTVPLSDPLVVLQSLAAGHIPETTVIAGALIIVAFYALVGGRVFCSWVCPVNPVTDLAAVVRRKLNLRGGKHIDRDTRFWMLALVLLLPMFTGMIIWELVNPVSQLMRGLVFGMGAGWFLIVAIFLFDLFYSSRAWCGSLCPLGAFYLVVGKISPLRVNAANREACNDCMDCYAVCPESQVIKHPLHGADKGYGPLIDDSACSNCGRCVDICSEKVFNFSTRFANKAEIKS